MGLWVPKPELDDDERVLWQVGANRTQGRRAVGGRLYVTDARLRFMANVVDRRTKGEDWVAERAAVTAAHVADRTMEGGPFSGGARRRVQVVVAGEDTYFVVNHAEKVAARLRHWAVEEPGG